MGSINYRTPVLLVVLSVLVIQIAASPTSPGPGSASASCPKPRTKGPILDCAAYDPHWYFDFQTRTCQFALGCEVPRFDTEEECLTKCAEFITGSN